MMYYEAIDLWNSPNSYLEHHGVKGMKWGVRKQKRREIRAYARKLNSDSAYLKRKKQIAMQAEKAREKNKPKIEALQKQAYALSRKYDFDADDGGGGSTSEAQKAGKKYMQIWDKISDLENEGDRYYSRSSHIDWVNKQVVKKYGRKTIDEAYNTPLYNLGKAYANIGSEKKFNWYE